MTKKLYKKFPIIRTEMNGVYRYVSSLFYLLLSTISIYRRGKKCTPLTNQKYINDL